MPDDRAGDRPGDPAVDAALARLRSRLAAESALIVGYSGGADSALLAWAAHQVLGPRSLAVTAVSASLPAAERAAAGAFAREHGIAHLEICTDELDRPEYRRNDGQRCFHCKTALFDAVEPLRRGLGARVALGTNTDDLGDHRPGQAAAVQRGAVAPLVDAGLGKAMVRAVSARLGLRTSAKPASACLSSRVAYGDEVTPELLSRIERAEAFLHGLGFAACRVRAHAAGTLARVEVPAADWDALALRRAEIESALQDCGFSFVTLDLAGLRSGSMNVLLPLPRVARPGVPLGGPAERPA